MTEISRLKSTSAAIAVVLGLFYFGLLGLLTFEFVRLGLRGQPTLQLLMVILAWVYSARMARTWIGLMVSGFLLDFRGLHAEDGRIVFISPAVRVFQAGEVTDARKVSLSLLLRRQDFLELEIRGGGKWRLPGFLLAQPVETAAARARQVIGAASPR